jgi:hypothetical protein
MTRIRSFALAGLVAASLALSVGPAKAGPCQGEVCPPCYTAKIDATWQNLTGLGSLFPCPS